MWSRLPACLLVGRRDACTTKQKDMKYQRKTDVVARVVAGENVLIPVHGCTRSVYTLNPTGCRLWDLLEQAQSEDALADALAAHYQISRAAAQADVRSFLEDLVRMELIMAME